MPRCLVFSLSAALLAGAALLRAQPDRPGDAATATPIEKLDGLTVSADRYKSMGGPIPIPFLLGRFPPFEFPFGEGEGVSTAAHLLQALPLLTNGATLFQGAEVRARTGGMPDWVVRGTAEFASARSPALVGNLDRSLPSWHGLSQTQMRVLGDGVSLTHPLDGSFSWAKVPAETLGRVELAPGAGAPAWGSGVLAGTLQFFAAPLHTELLVIDQPPNPIALGWKGGMQVSAWLGDFGTRATEILATLPRGRDIVQVSGRIFATNGFVLVEPAERGPIDTAAESRHRWFSIRWLHPVGQDLALVATVRAFEETRGLGTPFAKRQDRDVYAGIEAMGYLGHGAWKGLAYVQHSNGSEQSGWLDAARTIETPVADQFAAPTTTLGTMALAKFRVGGGMSVFGIDANTTQGEFRLHTAFAGGTFNQDLFAGGRRSAAGLFAFHDRGWGPNVQTTLGLRVDHWGQDDGHARITDRRTASLLSSDQYGSRNDFTPSASAGVTWLAPSKLWRLRANAQRAFRSPTMAELYRSEFGPGGVVLPDARLSLEHATSGEVAVEWRVYEPIAQRPANLRPNQVFQPPPPRRLLTLSTTAFWNEVRDPIAPFALPTASGPASWLVPGQVVRQRVNATRTESRGIEFGFRWVPVPAVVVAGGMVAQQSTLTANARPDADLPFVPQRYTHLAATWTHSKWAATTRFRWIGSEFSEPENLLTLRDVLILDLSINRFLSAQRELFLNIENAGNARVETNRFADGPAVLGSPRWLIGGVRAKW